jgi:Uma2 family endonuclease
MVNAATRLSVNEFLALPESDTRYELVNGRVERLGASGAAHGYIVAQVGRRIVNALGLDALYYLGTAVDFRTHPRTLRRPDLVYIDPHRVGTCIDPMNDIVVPSPDLVIEVLSPGDERRDTLNKFREYAQVGVPHYWTVDPPKHEVSLYRLSGDAYTSEALFREDQTLTSS